MVLSTAIGWLYVLGQEDRLDRLSTPWLLANPPTTTYFPKENCRKQLCLFV